MNIINLSVPAGVSSPVAECGAVMIGYVGEGGVTQVVLDFSAWEQAYGDGVVTLGVQRSGDPTWYPVVLDVDGTSAAWIVSKTDTDVEGMGVARFAYTVGGAEKRSAVWQFFVDRGLQSPEGDAPDPYESWVETLTELGTETLQNAQAAQNAAGAAEQSASDAEAAQQAAETAVTHYPKIVNDYWWVWDVERGEYVNTGVKAKGEGGEGGEGTVFSVNGQTGAVELDAEDVGALPDSSTLDDIPDGSTYKRPTAEQLQQIQTNAAGIQTQGGEIDQLQTDVDTIKQKIPNQASSTNQLADKAFVNSSIQTSTAHFRGSWPIWADVPTNPALYPADDDGITTPTTNDYMVLQDASGYTAYGYTLEGTWRFKYTGNWETNGRLGWRPEYQVNETPLTSAQLAALNSGATEALIEQISTNAAAIALKQAIINASGILKGSGNGQVSAAVAGSDYLAPGALVPYRTAMAQDVIDAAQNEEIAGKVSDVQIAGTSVVQDGVADVPIITGPDQTGVTRVNPDNGITVSSNTLIVNCASHAQVKAGANLTRPVVPYFQHTATFYGLAKAAGDTTQSASANAVGRYTESAKSAISEMLNGSVTVTGTTPTITAQPGVRYVCGEVTTLDITLPASGIVDVTFESGSVPTVLTITPPSGVTLKWANGFDPTSLDADTTYEINIMDGLGVAASWT